MAIRHRFDWIVTGPYRAARSGSPLRSPGRNASARRSEPILALDDGGARSTADAHDDPPLGDCYTPKRS